MCVVRIRHDQQIPPPTPPPLPLRLYLASEREVVLIHYIFLTERIVYFLSTVQCYNILEIYCCYKYKNIGRCVNLLLKKVCCC